MLCPIWGCRAIRADVLLQAEVILTTVIGAGALPGFFAPGQPRPTVSCIVLDEAYQCTVPAALVPLMAVQQLRHHFRPPLAHSPALHYPTRAVCYHLLSAHADRVLIGFRNPML